MAAAGSALAVIAAVVASMVAAVTSTAAVVSAAAGPAAGGGEGAGEADEGEELDELHGFAESNRRDLEVLGKFLIGKLK
jgi:hypothetical protein